jgi:hypothetical protein
MPTYTTEHFDLNISYWTEEVSPGRHEAKYRAQYWEDGNPNAKFGPTVRTELEARKSVEHKFPISREIK